MNGVTVQAQQPLEFANEADAVLFGSGIYTRAIAEAMGKRGQAAVRERFNWGIESRPLLDMYASKRFRPKRSR